MLTPCQSFAKNEGVETLDKALFTTKRRAMLAIESLCDRCPEDAKRDCGKRAQSIVTPAGVIPPFGVFGGVWYD